jgi:signal transduction histidine kinase
MEPPADVHGLMNTAQYPSVRSGEALAALQGISQWILVVDDEETVLFMTDALRRFLHHEDGASVEHSFEDVYEQFLPQLDVRALLRETITTDVASPPVDIIVDKRTIRVSCMPTREHIENARRRCVVLLFEDRTDIHTLEQRWGDFFSIASHELRSPLTAIKGNISLLLEYYGEQFTDTDLKQMIADISLSSERAVKLVNDYLEVSRLELGRISLAPVPTDVVQLLREVITEHQQVAQEKHIELQLSAPATLSGLIDAVRFKQVLTCLVDNALRSTKDGSVVVTLTALGRQITVSVRDTGEGVPQEIVPSLFQRFARSAEGRVVNTGLGLYVSRLLVELMGGQICLESTKIGEGSTFSVTVPLAS